MNTLFFKKLMTIAVIALGFSSAVQANTVKIGYVDVQYVMAKSPQRVAIAEKLKKEFKEPDEELKKLAGDFQKMQEKGKKDAATMSEQERLDLGRKLQEMEAKAKLKQKNLQEDMQRRSQEEQRLLYIEIQKAIKAVSEEEKYDMIVNREALLWASKATNLSDKVLAKLNASGK